MCAQDADLLLAKRLQEQEHAFAMLAGCAPALHKASLHRACLAVTPALRPSVGA
jgi:hypothetical protein